MIINAVSVNYTQVTILPPFKNFYKYTHLRKSNSHDQVIYTNTFEIYVFLFRITTISTCSTVFWLYYISRKRFDL